MCKYCSYTLLLLFENFDKHELIHAVLIFCLHFVKLSDSTLLKCPTYKFINLKHCTYIYIYMYVSFDYIHYIFEKNTTILLQENMLMKYFIYVDVSFSYSRMKSSMHLLSFSRIEFLSIL